MNDWDSFTFLANLPITETLQPAATRAFASTRSEAVRIGIVLALRGQTVTRETSQFLASLLHPSTRKLRTATLLALRPTNIHRVAKRRSTYAVDEVLTALETLMNTGVEAQLFKLILSILSEEPFVHTTQAASMARRIARISSKSALESEMMSYYQRKIAAAR